MVKWQEINGWLTEEEGLKLQELCKDKTIIEIGSYKGRSTVCIAQVAKKVHSVDTHTCLGNGQSQTNLLTTWDEFSKNIKPYPNIQPYIGHTHYWSDKLPKCDIAFIDGDHSARSVKEDLMLLQNKAELFIFHDYNTFLGVNVIVDTHINKLGIVDSLCWGTLKSPICLT